MYSRSTLFLAAAIIAGSAATAEAADVYNGEYQGSIKDDAIETILVPEPVHIPETMSWYIRGDVGYGVSADVDTTAILPEGQVADGIISPDGTVMGGIGFGRYLSPNTRIDFTFDLRDKEQVFHFRGDRLINITRVVDYDDGTAPAPGGNGPIDFELTVRDDDVKSLSTHHAMANFYYDFTRYGGLRPYIGGGVGIAMHEIQRNGSSQFVSCRQTSIPVDHVNVGTFDPNANNCPDMPAAELADIAGTHTQSGSKTTVGFGLAASLQAGLSYEMRKGLHLDTSYRFTYSSGSVLTTEGLADIETHDRTDQEVRIGLRYDIW